jgi:uncharacterized protein YndB with AHSA1/START domain
MTGSTLREATITLPSDREIVMQRLFDAPAHLLFEVWTRPEHVKKWYGVRSTIVTVCEIDLRVGGKWRWVVTTPQGMEIGFSGVFREIEPPRRLQRTEWYEAIPGAECLVTLSFDEKDGRTNFTTSMLFPDKIQRDMALKSGMELGVDECYRNIDGILAAMTSEA